MSKPIEPGCRARLVNCRNPDNEGKIVTVGMFIGRVPGYKGDMNWEIDKPVIGFGGAHQGEVHYHALQHKLQRIDDYDGNEAGSWEDIKDIWCPTETTINQ